MILKKYLKSLYFKLFVAILTFAPLAVSAVSNVETGLNQSRLRGIFGTGGFSGSQTASELIYNAIRIFLTFAGAIAVLFIVIGGFWYITSAGNEEQAEKGKNTLLNAIWGILIIVLSYALVTVVVNLVTRGTGLFG
jgi:hypothetical protein